MTNVARHANAVSVRISLVREGDELVLSVADDGDGISAGAEEKPGHLGLLGARERVHHLEGTLAIQTEAGKGTTITVRVPLAGQLRTDEEENPDSGRS